MHRADLVVLFLKQTMSDGHQPIAGGLPLLTKEGNGAQKESEQDRDDTRCLLLEDGPEGSGEAPDGHVSNLCSLTQQPGIGRHFDAPGTATKTYRHDVLPCPVSRVRRQPTAFPG